MSEYVFRKEAPEMINFWLLGSKTAPTEKLVVWRDNTTKASTSDIIVTPIIRSIIAIDEEHPFSFDVDETENVMVFVCFAFFPSLFVFGETGDDGFTDDRCFLRNFTCEGQG